MFKFFSKSPNIGNLIARRNLKGLTKILKNHKNPRVRATAAHGLGIIQDKKSVRPLIVALNDPSKGVRLQAAIALGEIIDSRAVNPLIRALSDDDKDVQLAAAEALGKIGDKQAVEPLFKSTSKGNYEAIIALGKLKDERVVEVLIDRISGRRVDELDLDKTIEALGKIGDPRAVKPLLLIAVKANGMTGGDGDTQTYHSAWKALEMLRDVSLEPLLEASKDEEDHIRRAAVRFLGMIGTSDVVPYLLDALKDDGDGGWIRNEAMYALSRLGTLALEPLINSLQDKNEKVQAMVAEALRNIGDIRAIDPLTNASENSSKYAKFYINRALDELRKKEKSGTQDQTI